MASAGKVQISLWHEVQRDENGRKQLKRMMGEKRVRISGENEYKTHERQRAAERECEL